MAALKVLFIPSGGRLAPATRYRIYQFLPALEREGIEYEIYSIISESTTRRMIKSPTFGRFHRFFYYVCLVAEKGLRALKIIAMAGRFDVVFLQRATFPFNLEKLLRARNENIIFDIDDSIYMPDTEERGIIGWIKKYIKKREVASVLRVSKCVIVENKHIKNFVSQYCGRVHVITGPIDTEKNFAQGSRAGSGTFTIGWIGSPSTTIYIKMIENALKRLSQRYKIKFRLIGPGSYSLEGVNVEVVDWSEDTEVAELHKFDVGIMPMPDNEWTRGKVGCKMLQYMANGIPAVVSYTPTNAEVVEDGVNGFLAKSEEEWVDKISRLIGRPELSRGIGLAARQSVEEKYSVITNRRYFLEIIESVYRQ